MSGSKPAATHALRTIPRIDGATHGSPASSRRRTVRRRARRCSGPTVTTNGSSSSSWRRRPGYSRAGAAASWKSTARWRLPSATPAANCSSVPSTASTRWGTTLAIASVVPQRVEAVEGTDEQLAAGVADGSLHLAVLFQDAAAPAREYPGLRRHELLDEPFVVTVGPEHRLARRRTVRLRELAGDPWVAPSMRGIVRNACVAAGFEPDIAYVTRDVLAIRAIVAEGLAVSLTSRLIAR